MGIGMVIYNTLLNKTTKKNKNESVLKKSFKKLLTNKTE
jgi:hypothetical protein